MTRVERIAMRAAENLAEAFAKANGSENGALLLRVALLRAEEEIGGQRTRNPVVMVSPLKAVIQGHAMIVQPRGDEGPIK